MINSNGGYQPLPCIKWLLDTSAYLLPPPSPHEGLLGIHELSRLIFLERRHNAVEDILHPGVVDRIVGAVEILVNCL